MKNILLLIPFLFIELSVFSQEEQTYTDSMYTYNYTSSSDSALIHKNFITYEYSGNKTLSVEYAFWSNVWILGDKNEYTYDSNGNMTIDVQYDWDSDGGQYNLQRKSYFYYEWYSSVDSDTICAGDSLLWQGQNLKTDGTYYANYISVIGRDSIYEMNLTVNPKPSAFSITGQNNVDEYQIVFYSVPTNPEVAYNWLVENGNMISYPQTNSSEIQWGSVGEGLVYCIAENQYACLSDTSELQVNFGSTDIDNLFSDKIKLYPNPVKDILYIETSLEFYEIGIFDMTGKKLLICNSKKHTIDMSFLNSGTYIFIIKDSKGKLIDERVIIME